MCAGLVAIPAGASPKHVQCSRHSVQLFSNCTPREGQGGKCKEGCGVGRRDEGSGVGV